MRIIAGTSGGIPIKVPPDATRPTPDRVRESIFSSLGDVVVEAKVLDLYAGSGSLGIESLSRGAKSALFVENSRSASRIVESNLAKTGLASKGVVMAMKVERFLSNLGADAKFDLIFADPPYAKDEELSDSLAAFLKHEKLSAALDPAGIFVLETSSRVPLPEMDSWTKVKEKTYGETRVTFFTPRDCAA